MIILTSQKKGMHDQVSMTIRIHAQSYMLMFNDSEKLKIYHAWSDIAWYSMIILIHARPIDPHYTWMSMTVQRTQLDMNLHDSCLVMHGDAWFMLGEAWSCMLNFFLRGSFLWISICCRQSREVIRRKFCHNMYYFVD